MENELQHMSTAELVQFAAPNRYKFRSVAINGVLGQLIVNAINVLQDASSCEDEEGNVSSEELRAELAALYDDTSYNLLVRVLSSAVVDTRALAGATYLLALLTAGPSVYAKSFRNKMARGVGTIRLVALMSQESESVKCNALLVMGNLLRHCEAVHSEFLRLGGIRKLAALFRQAHEEPQQNVCMDAFLCLCHSSVTGVLDELTRTGCVGLVLEMVTPDSSDRVLKKALHAFKTMLSDDSRTRSSILELSLVKRVLSVLRNDKLKVHLLVGLSILKSICCANEGESHRRKFVKHGGVKFLVDVLGGTEDMETLLEVVQTLATIAALDINVRKEIAQKTPYLPSYLIKVDPMDIQQPEHVAAFQFLLTVCDKSWQLDDLEAIIMPTDSGVKEGFGHAELVCT